jgi:hypothetical protein
MMAHFTLGDLVRFSFGDRWQFGIECEMLDRPGEPFGSFWYWIAGQLVCNTDAEELLVIAFSVVLNMLESADKRPEQRFDGLTAEDKLSLVDWARFGEDDAPEAERWSAYGRNGFMPYRLIPKDGGPWFDGWEGILTETEETELVVWRRAGTNDVREHRLPRGTFTQVATEFCAWFEIFRRRSLRSENH